MSAPKAPSTSPVMSGPAIIIENLGKRYTIGHQRAKGDGLRHAMEGAIRAPLAWLRSSRRKKMQPVDFWALKDVSFRSTRAKWSASSAATVQGRARC